MGSLSPFQVIFGGLTSIGGLAGIGALWQAVVQKKKINAEARRIGVDSDMVMSDKALEMYGLARREAQEAKTESRDCRLLVDALRDHVDHLERIMRDNGMRPPRFRPPTLLVDQEDQ